MLLLDAYIACGKDMTKLNQTIAGSVHNGIIGEVSFDENGDNRNKAISMNRVQDGRFNFYEHVPQVQ